MSDILLQALLGASKRDAERDPFLAGARGIEQVDSSQYDMSPGQRILAGVLSGLGGGVSRGIGESRVKDKYNTRSNNLMEGMRTGKLMEALAADEELSSIAPLYAMQEEQNKVGRLQELNKALLPKGYMMKSLDGNPEQVFDPIADEVRKAVKIKEGELAAERSMQRGGIPALSNVPKELQDSGFKEIQSKANRVKANEFIDSQFDVAKDVSSIEALLPGTTGANEVAGVAQGLRTYIQKYLGREMNGPEQVKFLTLLPDWNDTKAQIELKRERFKDLMDSLTPATPVLDTYGLNEAATNAEQIPVEIKYMGGQPVRVRRLPDGRYEEVE